MEGTPHTKFCLVHLFTAQSFRDGVLGYGYVADPQLGKQGGICSAGQIEGQT